MTHKHLAKLRQQLIEYEQMKINCQLTVSKADWLIDQIAKHKSIFTQLDQGPVCISLSVEVSEEDDAEIVQPPGINAAEWCRIIRNCYEKAFLQFRQEFAEL